MPSSWYRGPDVLQVAERIWRNASRSGISTSNSTTSFALPYNIPLVSKDEVIEIDTQRLGWIHRKKLFGSKNAFIVIWLDTGEQTAFISRKDQQRLKKTGNNINNSDSD